LSLFFLEFFLVEFPITFKGIAIKYQFSFNFKGAEMEINTFMELNHRDGRSYLLRNEYGQCLAVRTNDNKKPNESMATMFQSNCNPLEKGQLWKFDSQDFLCNEWKKCLTAFSVYCLSVVDNSNAIGAMATVAPCTKPEDKGQLWHFAWYSG